MECEKLKVQRVTTARIRINEVAIREIIALYIYTTKKLLVDPNALIFEAGSISFRAEVQTDEWDDDGDDVITTFVSPDDIDHHIAEAEDCHNYPETDGGVHELDPRDVGLGRPRGLVPPNLNPDDEPRS